MKVKYRGQPSHSVLSMSISFVVTSLSVSVTNVGKFEL